MEIKLIIYRPTCLLFFSSQEKLQRARNNKSYDFLNISKKIVLILTLKASLEDDVERVCKKLKTTV